MDAFAADVEDDVITPALTAGVVAQDAEEEERRGEQGGGGNEEQAGPDQHQHHHQRAAPEIKAIDRSSVARICSGQVCLLGWLIVGGLCLLSSIPLTLPPSLPPSLVPPLPGRHRPRHGRQGACGERIGRRGHPGNYAKCRYFSPFIPNASHIPSSLPPFLPPSLLLHLQVEVKLKDWGVDLIEVSDNGSGVAPKNYQVCTCEAARGRDKG